MVSWQLWLESLDEKKKTKTIMHSRFPLMVASCSKFLMDIEVVLDCYFSFLTAAVGIITDHFFLSMRRLISLQVSLGVNSNYEL